MNGALVRLSAAGAGLLTAAMTVVITGFAQSTPAAFTATPAAADIPATYLRLYRQAAPLCPGLGWPVLAGVGKVESNHGRAASLVSSTGAQGPMQFEPATWVRYGVDADGDGRADPFDAADAIAAAAGYLCALHVANDPRSALIAYNCGTTSTACQAVSAGYASLVLSWAARYATAAGPVPAAAAATAIRAALAQVGTPYVWGGAGPGGFDCSGLVQWSYARAGLVLPRVAQDQYDAGPAIPADGQLSPGDLVFFGADATHVTHVGLYLGDGRMVDAPHTGATVRVEPLAGFIPRYVGATRPTGDS